MRLRAAPGAPPFEPPPQAGVHRWSRMPGVTHVCEGAGAPVILHFANAGFGYFWRKFEM